jgi:predicted lysophospholipase L1 biosynthesis ABC-type transport system permease subunit
LRTQLADPAVAERGDRLAAQPAQLLDGHGLHVVLSEVLIDELGQRQRASDALLATLRAAGIGRHELARMITAENALVVIAGIAPGLLVGYEVARAFMAPYSTDWYSFDLHMRTSTPVLAALAMVLVALASQLPGLRAVRRIDIARVVRERSL